MAGINDICREIVDNVEDALGAAVVDLSTGLMLGAHHNVPYFTSSYMDAVSAAAVDMFRGKGITNVEKRLAQTRGEEVRNSMLEIQMTTPKTFHFMVVVPGKPNALAILITGRRANLGMGWAGLRSALPKIEPMCP
ncbi:hypothetical protein MNBD_GAMMA20-2419 [hydrothermal vent metagenome]|uniref:Roadblock/LAMTOR2 domain-containing protein n=1 Tax=hydrothermal vent metagenome TaxID=652676 RepID=A0A3B1AYF7_9ZZZZ|nr:hypothetical protein [Gammaproteobacteria bacterium]MCF6363231.1 hypothetical protein [Gammaproteobacteria bacterium]